MRPLHSPSPDVGRARDKVLCDCKICGKPIFRGKPTAWSRNPLGQVHPACKKGGAS